MKSLRWHALSIAFLAAVILGWKIAADTKFINPMFLPGPERAFSTLGDWIANGELWRPLGLTVWRTFAGWLAASFLGVALGAAIASSRVARDLFQPSAEFLRPLPASAVLPPAILLLGLSDRMIIFVVAFGSIWPILLGAIHGIRALDPRLSEVARLMRFSPWQRIWKFQLPNALPDIFAGMRVSISIALIITVAAEMMSSLPGLGQMVLFAARAFKSAEIFAGVIVLGAIGLLTNTAMRWIEDRLLRWRPVQIGA